MALMAITQHHGRAGAPTDQVHIESSFSHLKERLATPHQHRRPAVPNAELGGSRGEYYTERLHTGLGDVTRDDSFHGRGPSIRRAPAADFNRARVERIKHNRASKS